MSSRRFIPPSAPAGQWIPRKSVMHALSLAARRGVVFISAPGGCGKTVALAQWLTGKRNKVAWLSLDRYDNDPRTFYAGMLGAMAHAQKASRRLRALEHGMDTAADPLNALLKALSLTLANEKHYVLVLDDFQAIDNPEIMQAFPLIVRRVPSNFTLFVLSRGSAPEPFASGLIKDEIALLSAGELHFTASDVLRLSRLRGIGLTEREVLFKPVLDMGIFENLIREKVTEGRI